MSTMMLSRPTTGRVDRARAVIKGVKLVGNISRRNRRYPQHVLRNAIRLYEGTDCYVNHVDPGSRRKAEDKIGKIRNVRESMDGNGLVGDLHYIPSHPMAESLAWAAENDPTQYGLSHNANGPTRREPDGSETVLRIDRIQSVDLVGAGATVESLFEDEGWLFDLQESLDGANRGSAGRRIATEGDRVAWVNRHRDGTALQESATPPPASTEPPAAPPPADSTEGRDTFRLRPAAERAAAIHEFRRRCRSR